MATTTTRDRETTNKAPSILSQAARVPDDTVFYSIIPDSAISSSSSSSAAAAAEISSSLQSLHVEILNFLSPHTADYIWQHEPFTLSLSFQSKPSCFCFSQVPHLHGKVRFGGNLEDEWFVVFLLFEISRNFPSLFIRVWDNDGEFLLIEAAFHLPKWINPDNSENRVFIRQGEVHIVPRKRIPNPSLVDSLKFIINCAEESRASESVQAAVKSRIKEYPERARKNVMKVRVRVPVSVAQVLKHEPCLISLAVEGFYDRDIDTMTFAAKMEKFLSRGREEELVCVSVRMSRAMYAQLVQQTFQAPRCYPMPNRTDREVYLEAELGMKIACGFEMMYWQRKKEGSEENSSSWEAYKESLERIGYFEGLLPGSKEYRRLMENAKEHHKKSSSYTRASEMMSVPVRRIDEILALPHSAEHFRSQEVPASDDDSWLYGGEEELNSVLLERQKEMELYNSKKKKKEDPAGKQDSGPSSSNFDEFDLGDITKSMKAFVDKVSSYKGAEVPEDSVLNEVDLDVDRFMKDMESVLRQGSEDNAIDMDSEEGSSSDMDFDDSEDESDTAEASGSKNDAEDAFMRCYSNVLNEELRNTSLEKSFVRASEQSSRNDEGPSNATEDMDEDFTPVDVDLNLVKNLLDSFSSQQGLPGPASNLLGLMGRQLPHDSSKDK